MIDKPVSDVSQDIEGPTRRSEIESVRRQVFPVLETSISYAMTSPASKVSFSSLSSLAFKTVNIGAVLATGNVGQNR